MNTDLHKAVIRGDTDQARTLLDACANINGLDRYNQTPLMNAAKLGNTELVRYLVARGANLDVTAKYHLTALMLAIIFYHEEIACTLIDAGADITARGSKGALGFNGKTALDLAKERGLERVGRRLEQMVG